MFIKSKISSFETTLKNNIEVIDFGLDSSSNIYYEESFDALIRYQEETLKVEGVRYDFVGQIKPQIFDFEGVKVPISPLELLC